MKVIIPMAGLGTRFSRIAMQNPEYRAPKPFISVRDIKMVRWATGSFPFINHPDTHNDRGAHVEPKDLIFIILKEHNDMYNMSNTLRDIYSDSIRIIELPGVTRGAAETAYCARDLVEPNDDLLITDSDHYFDGSILEKAIDNRHRDTVGIIPIFRARNEGIPKWSYSLLKDSESNLIDRVGEKDVTLMNAGAHANIGAYYFSKASLFFNTARDAIANERRTGSSDKAEFYIAPLYQDLIDSGYRIEAAITPEVWGLGTPEDLEYFLINNNESSPKW